MPPLSQRAIEKRQADFLQVVGQLDFIDRAYLTVFALILLNHQQIKNCTIAVCAGLATGGLILIPFALLR